jgi:hypothetical protein
LHQQCGKQQPRRTAAGNNNMFESGTWWVVDVGTAHDCLFRLVEFFFLFLLGMKEFYVGCWLLLFVFVVLIVVVVVVGRWFVSFDLL